MKIKLTFFAIIISAIAFAQQEKKFNLYKLFQKEKLNIINREIRAIDSLTGNYIHVSEKTNEGIIWFKLLIFG